MFITHHTSHNSISNFYFFTSRLHDDENQTILVENVRVVCHQGTNRVKMIFVDFENKESLKNALHLDKPFRDKVVRVDAAEEN